MRTQPRVHRPLHFRILVVRILVAVLLGGCSKDNPAFTPSPVPDQGPAADGSVPWQDTGPGGDATLPPDLVPAPDSMPWTCTSDAQCNDNKPCTRDRCVANVCENPLIDGNCLIGAYCYKKGDDHPSDSCSACDPATDPRAWTAKADGLACDQDGLSCTVDACQAGKCAHTPVSGTCAVGGTCFKDGDPNPSNDCEVCDAGKAKTAWSPEPDNTPCKLDGLSCTTDVCVKGTCTHPVVSGCLISGACVPDGAALPSSPCEVCVPKVSTTALQAATGQGCTVTSSGGQQPGMCVGKTCHGFTSVGYAPTGAVNTSLTDASYIPGDKKVWAVGVYEDTPQGGDKGVILDVDSALSSGSSPTAVLASAALYDVSYRMAVGEKGLGYLHDGKAWSQAQGLATALGNQDRLSVWGASVGGKDTFYLGGAQGGNVAPVVVCVAGASSAGLSCANQSGFDSGASIGRLFGTLSTTGYLGPMWGAVTGSNMPEDIYYNDGASGTWTTGGPHGCKDSGNNPCANTNTITYALHGSGADDVWLTGSGGMILHYDGKKWTRVSNVIPSQTAYTFYGVFSSKKDGVAVLAAYANGYGNNGQVVRLFAYNTTLDAWLSPVTLSQAPYNTPNALLDIAGTDLQNLTLVGQRRVSGSQGIEGWIVKLN